MVIQINGDTKIYILSRYLKKIIQNFFSFWLFFFRKKYLEENVNA